MADSSLVIRRIRARPVLAPMKLPLHTASGAIDQAALVLLDLDTTAGITGRAYLFAPSPAHLAPIVALVEAMSEMLAGDAAVPSKSKRSCVPGTSCWVCTTSCCLPCPASTWPPGTWWGNR